MQGPGRLPGALFGLIASGAINTREGVVVYVDHAAELGEPGTKASASASTVWLIC